MRHSYQRSDETFKVLTDHLQIIAREMDCDVSHVNRIKNGEYRDPYAPFRHLFRAACYAGAPVDLWLNDLNSIYARANRQPESSNLSGNILDKIQADAETLSEIVKGLADSKLDRAECHAILHKLAQNKKINDTIERIVINRLGEISESEIGKFRIV